jgi:hypothetical protein
LSPWDWFAGSASLSKDLFLCLFARSENQLAKERAMTSTESRNAVLIALISGGLTLLGTASTPFIGWLSNKATARNAEIEMCVKRVDADQYALRSKGEMFLKATSNFQSIIGDPITSDNASDQLKVIRSTTKTVSEIGWGLGAYAGSGLASASIELAISLDSMSTGPFEKRQVAAAEIAQKLSHWITQYQKADSDFDHKRRRCYSDSGANEG